MKAGIVLALGGAAFVLVAGAAPASAQPKDRPASVRDTTYRGTLVCTKLPFIFSQLRSAIEAKISGNSVNYRRPVVIAATGAVDGYEEGTGTIDGDKITLKGTWKKGASSFEANYVGTFVRRSAKLSGAQVWNYAGKPYTRTCTGVITRPLAAFLPREKTKN